MRRQNLIVGVCVLSLMACAVNVPQPTPEQAGGDEVVLGQLRDGRSLYISKCGGCHGLYAVERYSDRDWYFGVHKMVDLKKVKLTELQEERIVGYLTAVNGRE